MKYYLQTIYRPCVLSIDRKSAVMSEKRLNNTIFLMYLATDAYVRRQKCDDLKPCHLLGEYAAGRYDKDKMARFCEKIEKLLVAP